MVRNSEGASFQSLRAADLMQDSVVTVWPNANLRESMELMTENHVTGLPVIDDSDRCVGVISATDILNYEQEHADSIADANAELAHHFDPDLQRWETVRVSSFALEQFGEVKVSELMSPELISVDRQTPAIEIARIMTKQRIHRVLVLSDDERLLGIVTSTDFVRSVADGVDAE
ncbi:MAG: CBS domain-containing protein [Planctomycetota bacterium]